MKQEKIGDRLLVAYRGSMITSIYQLTADFVSTVGGSSAAIRQLVSGELWADLSQTRTGGALFEAQHIKGDVGHCCCFQCLLPSIHFVFCRGRPSLQEDPIMHPPDFGRVACMVLSSSWPSVESNDIIIIQPTTSSVFTPSTNLCLGSMTTRKCGTSVLIA